MPNSGCVSALRSLRVNADQVYELRGAWIILIAAPWAGQGIRQPCAVAYGKLSA